MIQPKKRQSMLDIALEHAGSIEAAWDIAMANGISLSDDIHLVPMQATQVLNQRIVTHFQALHHSPATAITKQEINTLLGTGEGIEFWAIEYDFVVS